MTISASLKAPSAALTPRLQLASFCSNCSFFAGSSLQAKPLNVSVSWGSALGLGLLFYFACSPWMITYELVSLVTISLILTPKPIIFHSESLSGLLDPGAPCIFLPASHRHISMSCPKMSLLFLQFTHTHFLTFFCDLVLSNLLSVFCQT